MTPLKDLIKRGFCISEVTEQKDNNLAFNFLIDSFKAYFRTAEMLNTYMEEKYVHNETDEKKLNGCVSTQLHFR